MSVSVSVSVPVPAPRPGSVSVPVQLQPGTTDLRVAAPVAIVWIVAVVLVGVPGAAPVVGIVAAGLAVLVAVGGVVLGRRSDRHRVVLACAGPALVVTTLTVLLTVSVAVGESRRVPPPLFALASGAGSVSFDVVLSRDLAPGDRSVPARLERADELGGMRVPVRFVPSGAHRDGTLAAGTRLTGSGVLDADDPGAATAFVLFVRGEPAAEAPGGLLGARRSSGRPRAFPSPGPRCCAGWRSGTGPDWTRPPRPRWRRPR